LWPQAQSSTFDLRALEVCSRRGAIKIHVYLYLLTGHTLQFIAHHFC